MNGMKKTKGEVYLKRILRTQNTGGIVVIAGLLIILVIASYTFILQGSYTKTALQTEIARDTASADAVHKLVDGKIGKEDFDQIQDQSDEMKQVYKSISSYLNEIRTLNSTRYIYTAARNEEGKLVYVVDGLDSDADDVRHPGDYIEEEMVPYIDRALSGETVYSQDIVDTTWGPIFTACYPVSANHDGTGEVVGAFCIEMDMQSAYGMVNKTNHISIICGLIAGAVLLLICLFTYYVYQKRKAEEQRQKQLLMKAAEEADAANKAKSVFLLSISHDIRTPMNAIIGFTNIALHQDSVSDIHDSLEKVQKSSDHLLSLLNDVLDFSRIESGKVSISPEPVDITQLIDNVQAIMNGLLYNRNLKFEVHRERSKNQWVIDPVAAPIVQRIYRMTMEGKGPYQIAAILSAEHIEIPAYYHQKLGIGLWQTREIKEPYKWGSSTIVHILTNPCYLGHTCNFKTRKHFKDKKSHYVDQDQWTIIENTQEPIIDQETYDNVQRIRAGIRRYPDGWGEAHPLGGLLYCADCGSPMYVNRTGNGKRVANFSCSGYGKIPVGSKCSSGHRVNADSVMALIQETLREIVRFSKEDEEEFVRIVKAEVENQQSSEIKGQKTRLAACKKRLDELETLICKIYEDNALGKLPDKRYQILDAQYAKEQESLEAEAASLQKAVDEYESGQKSADKFIALVKKYQNFEKLDTVMLNEFIYKIFVHERDYKGVANSPQTIEIYFNFIGKFGTQEVNRPSEEERAEIAEKERLRKKRHEAYLRRKANGWQDAYYQKHKAAKKAAMDAKKEAIRAEDRAKGVYYLPNQKGESA